MNLINSIKRGGAFALAILIGFLAILIAPFVALGKCFKGLAQKFRIRTAWQLAIAILRGLFMRPAAFAILICAGALSSLPALANDQMQSDTNSLAVFSTNTFKLYSDVTGSFTNGQQTGNSSFIYVTKGNDVWLECGGVFTNTVAGASNITYRIAASVSGSQWTNSYATVTVSVPASSTNYASSVLYIAHPPPFLALRAIENVNTGNVTGRKGSGYLKAYVKDGI